MQIFCGSDVTQESSVFHMIPDFFCLEKLINSLISLDLLLTFFPQIWIIFSQKEEFLSWEMCANKTHM